MTRYAYTAVPIGAGGGRGGGGVVSGQREALDERAVRDALRSEGLVAVTVRPKSVVDAWRSLFSGERLTRSDSLWFFSTLSFMLESRVPIDEAVSSMEGLAPSARLARALALVREELRGGSGLSEAVSRREGLAASRHVALLRVGERSGHLSRVSDLIRRSMETSSELRRTLVSGLIYPGLLLVSAVVVLWALGVFVIPRFAAQLTAMGGELPWQTAVTLWAAGVLVWLLPLLGLVVVAGVLWYRRFGSAVLRSRVSGLVLRTPVVGGLVWHREGAMIAETMATMLEGGADALDALERAVEVSSHPVVRERLSAARSGVREGEDLAEALRDRGVLPGMAGAVVSVGMRSGDLGGSMRRAAELCVERQRTMTQRLLTLMEPGLIVFMAGSVFWVVYSLVSGMLAVTEAAR